MEILKSYGIPTKKVDAISILLYKDTEAQVTTPDGDTLLREIYKETPSHPFLFIIALDMSLEKLPEKLTPRQSSRHVATYITDTDFADDLALISDYLKEAQLLLSRQEVAAKTVGLHVN